MDRYILALHIIFVVTWFSGLFYIVRLFIYHVEAAEKPEPERSILTRQYKIMQKRLWFGITWPSMIITLFLGTWLLYLNFAYLIEQGWFILKLIFVLGLVLYHIQCHSIFSKLKNDKITWTSLQLRIWNEVATLFLFAIVFLVIPKQNSGWVWSVIGFVALAVALYAGIKIYQKGREKSGEKED